MTIHTRLGGHITAFTGILALLAAAIVAQADVLTISPGAYGSYRADNTQIRAGSYSLRKTGEGFIWQDRTEVQLQDLSILSDGTYEIVARDANVVIGTFVNTAGVPSSPTGSVSLAGNNLSFVNHNVVVSGAAGWLFDAKLWNMAFSENGIARYVMPSGNNWGGWYGRIGDGNNFRIDVSNTGAVTVDQDAFGIGITGGQGTLKFPTVAPRIGYTVTSAVGGNPPGANYTQLDHATGNLGFGVGPTIFYLYEGNYSFVTGLPGINDDGSFFTPALIGGNVDILAPFQDFTYSFTYHSAANGQDYLFTFFAVPEPASVGLVCAGVFLLLKRRRHT